MSLFRWIAGRVVPLCVVGGATLYLLLVQNSISGSDKFLFVGFLVAIFVSLCWKNLATHPAYLPTLLCLVVGLVFYQSWQQYGLHAQSTIVIGILLAVIVLMNFAKFVAPPGQ